MSEKSKSRRPGGAEGRPSPADIPGTPAPDKGAKPPRRLPPLFRRIDWYTFGLTTCITLIGYWWTLAPDLTLEDSGELAVASMYAGVPHPPGYPVWTIYTWLFTVLFPVSNMAYRVAFSSAVAAALACGLVSLIVSRGSSMMIEGIERLKQVDRRSESALCMASGFLAGMLIGFNGFMWSQAVIVEVYTLSVLSLTGVLVCLLRWIYAPAQRGYLYWAFFWFGISFNNHQSLLVIALGLEVAILVASPRLGRDLFFWNTVVFLGGLVGKKMGLITTLNSLDPTQVSPLFIIYILIGVASFGIWAWLAMQTRINSKELARDLTLVGSLAYALTIIGVITNFVDYFDFKRGPFVLFNVAGLGCVGTFGYLVLQTTKLGREWLGAIACGLAWTAGAAFYVYMPLASMTNPPLNWAYPRTVQGLFHAFTRGQYERINPTNVLSEPSRFFDQILMYIDGALAEFNLVYLAMALVPFLFYRWMQKRERVWVIGLTAIYICLSFFLLILLNPAPDRQSRDLNRVFFTASHVMIAMGIGYGFTLLGATLATQWERYRQGAILSAGVVAVIALGGAITTFVDTYYGVLRLAAVVGLILAGAAFLCLLVSRRQAPLKGLLLVALLMPLHPVLSHWSDNEQRGHLFGFWFGHDMFTPPFNGADGQPIYPEMARDAILFGGTDPGRFNPTYMIFCESFIDPEKRRNPQFDRRDVYLITQNALADGTYLNYIRAHYNRSTQIDPLLFSELLRGPSEVQQNYRTNLLAKLMLPIDHFFTALGDSIEKRRRTFTSWFQEDHFTDLAGLAVKLKPGPDRDPLSQFLFDHLAEETRALLTGAANEKALRSALAEDLNRIMDTEYLERRKMEDDLQRLDTTIKETAAKQAAIQSRIQDYLKAGHQIYDRDRFAHVTLSDRLMRFLKQSPPSHTIIRLNRLLLEEAYPGLIAPSKGGLYPDLEINTPSPTESEKSFRDYLADAQRRLDHDRNFPNEPPQIKPGEDVRIIENRVQVAGQVAVMAINALLTKIIFDRNPGSEFYVEESFPLDWMFPYLTPYGIIMKINREPVPEFTEEILAKDHEFWSQYSQRAIGNWIRYETSVSNICEFVERVHVRRDYDGFEGDRKFIRDSDAQKAFSKLRSSIAGLYNFRISQARTVAEQQRVIKEAEFAFKQAFAFCPYSPEALYRYVQLLTSLGRVDEALILAETSSKLDRYNTQILGLIGELRRIRNQQSELGNRAQVSPITLPSAPVVPSNDTEALRQAFEKEPTNPAKAMQLVQAYQQEKAMDKASAVLDTILESSNTTPTMLLFAAQKFNELVQIPKVARSLERLVELLPDNPEAWFDLAGVQMVLNQPTQALVSLRQSLLHSQQRLAADPKALDLFPRVTNDARFAAMNSMPEYQALIKEFGETSASAPVP